MKPIYDRILSIMLIMSVQTLVLALMVIDSHNWMQYLFLWWLLHGLVWYQYFKASKGE